MIGNHTMPTELLRGCDGGTLWCISEWANNVTQGMFWVFLLLAFTIVTYMATMNRFGNTRAFGYGAFVGMIGAIWLAIMQLMDWWIATAFILVGVVGIVAMIMSEK